VQSGDKYKRVPILYLVIGLTKELPIGIVHHQQYARSPGNSKDERSVIIERVRENKRRTKYCSVRTGRAAP
jgi:hypothetical protein